MDMTTIRQTGEANMAIISAMNIFRSKRFSIVLTTLALVVAGPATHADPVSWIAADGAWETAANWSTGSLPTANDFVDIQHPGSVTSSAADNRAKEFVNKSALSVTAGKLAVTGTIDTFGALSVQSAAQIDAGRIYVQSGGGLDVFGVGANVSVIEGVFSSGVWTMSGGATLGAESFDNFNSFDLSSGGRATANSMINHGGAGVSISDADSALTIHGNLTNNGSVFVSEQGLFDTHSVDNNALIRVTGGSQIAESIFNRGQGSVVEIKGPNAHLTVTDALTNNNTDGASTLKVTDGASAHINNLVNDGAVDIIDGHLTGRDLDNRSGVVIGGAATVDLSGRLLNSGVLGIDATSVVRTAEFQQTGGYTSITGGTLGATTEFGVQIAAGEFAGHGTIDGKLVLSGTGLLSVDDQLSFDSTSHFDVMAGLELLGGTFAADLGGTAFDDHDVLNVQGAALLGGTLKVALLDGYNPILGDAFDIILADSISGAFATMVLPGLSDGLVFTTINGGTFFRLQVTAVPLPASALLLGGALSVLGFSARRRRAA
jgi:hypothetical protein